MTYPRGQRCTSTAFLFYSWCMPSPILCLNCITNIYCFRNPIWQRGLNPAKTIPKRCYGLKCGTREGHLVKPMSSSERETTNELEGTQRDLGVSIKHIGWSAPDQYIQNVLVIKYISIARYLVLLGYAVVVREHRPWTARAVPVPPSCLQQHKVCLFLWCWGMHSTNDPATSTVARQRTSLGKCLENGFHGHNNNKSMKTRRPFLMIIFTIMPDVDKA